jgi:hypothetical protein
MFARILRLVFQALSSSSVPTAVALPSIFFEIGPLGLLLAEIYRNPAPEGSHQMLLELMDAEAEAERKSSEEARSLVNAIDDFEFAVDELLICADDQYDEDDRFRLMNAMEEVRSEAFGVACALQRYLARHSRSHLH